MDIEVGNTAHLGTPVPFGLPVFRKFVHAATNVSDRPVSLAFRSRGRLLPGDTLRTLRTHKNKVSEHS